MTDTKPSDVETTPAFNKRIHQTHSKDLTITDLRRCLKETLGLPDHVKGALLDTLAAQQAFLDRAYGIINVASNNTAAAHHRREQDQWLADYRVALKEPS